MAAQAASRCTAPTCGLRTTMVGFRHCPWSRPIDPSSELGANRMGMGDRPNCAGVLRIGLGNARHTAASASRGRPGPGAGWPGLSHLPSCWPSAPSRRPRPSCWPAPARRPTPAPTPTPSLTIISSEFSVGNTTADLGSNFLERLGSQATNSVNRIARTNPGGGGASQSAGAPDRAGQSLRHLGADRRAGRFRRRPAQDLRRRGGHRRTLAPGVNVGLSLDQSRSLSTCRGLQSASST